MRGSRLALVLLALAAFAPARARAQVISDLEAFSSFVPPNVMLLFDTSDHMYFHIWDDDFNPNKQYAHPCPSLCSALGCDWGVAPLRAATSCPGEGNSGDLCPDNNYYLNPSGSNDTPHTNSGTVTRTICGVTRTLYEGHYSLNYLNWLYGVATDAQLANESQDFRMTSAKRQLLDVIALFDDRQVRWGYSEFRRDGAHLDGPINDRQTQARVAQLVGQATADVGGAAPISEALVDEARYFYGRRNMGLYPAQSHVSPIDSACRKSFMILVSAGEPSDDDHGTLYDEFLGTIGNYDHDANECSLVSDGDGSTTADECTDAPSTGRDDGYTFGAAGTDWLDDVAGYMANTDFSTITGDQPVYTYVVGFYTDSPLLQETAANGQGRFYTTNPADADGLANVLKAAFIDIIERSTAFAAAAVPSSRTSFGDGFYRSYFIPSANRAFWEGHLEAYRLSESGQVLDRDGNLAIDPNTGAFPDPPNPIWDVATMMLDPNRPRALYTTKSSARTEFNTTNINATDLDIEDADLASYPNYSSLGYTTTSAMASAIVNYVHGKDQFDDDVDSDTTELRSKIIGDFYHSAALVVGPPRGFLFGEEGYGVPSESAPLDGTFLDRYKHRDRIVYVGSNGGMLHALDAGEFEGDDPNTEATEITHYTFGTGAERWGYIPGMLLDELRFLPINRPKTYYYVDSSPVVADAWLPTSADPNDFTQEPHEWATVLMVGLRQGGSGYLVLDVTDPDGADPNHHGPFPRLIREITPSSLSYLADTWSEPVIARVRQRAADGAGDHCGRSTLDDGDCRERWVAIFGAGYERTGDPNLNSYISSSSDPAWTNRGKAIYMVALDNGAVLARIGFDASGTTGPSTMRYAIASSPAVLDENSDGLADLIYVGDLGGQLWKWDVSEVGEDSDADGRVDNWDYGIFFQTSTVTLSDSTVHYRSIFFPPAVARASGTLNLAFGTGERTDLTFMGEATTDENNRFYVIKDEHPTGAGSIGATLTEDDLDDITQETYDADPTNAGYYFKGEDAEKFITNNIVFSDFVITTSYTPNPVPVDVCERSGNSLLYIFDLLTGRGYYLDENTVGQAARQLSIGNGVANDPRISISNSGDQMYIITSSGGLVQMPPPPRPTTGNWVYWRQRF